MAVVVGIAQAMLTIRVAETVLLLRSFNPFRICTDAFSFS